MFGFGNRISGSEVLSGSVRASNSRSEGSIFSPIVNPVQVCVCIEVCISVVGSFIVSVFKLVLSLDIISRLSVFGSQVYEAGLFRVSELGTRVLLRAKVSTKGGKTCSVLASFRPSVVFYGDF